jgi:hypothetical protein
MSHTEFLDFDALVRKHVWIVSSCRYFQLASWGILIIVSFLLAFGAFAILQDLFQFVGHYLQTQEWPLFDFHFIRFIIHELLFGDSLRN